MRIALVLPPLSQLNTPYPSISYLARWLGEQGVACEQHDLGLALALRLFSPEGLGELFEEVEAMAEDQGLPEPAWCALALREAHIRAIGPVLRFLQGKDRSAAPRIVSPAFLPAGPRVEATVTQGLAALGPMAVEDRARLLATRYLEDLADLVTATVDPGFGLARYQHHLAAGPVTFDAIEARLAETTLLDAWLDTLCDERLLGPEGVPDLVGISVPFPGTLLGALRLGRRLRRAGARVVLGGGWVSTELREVDEPRLWDHADAIVFDEGEGPLMAILERLEGGADRRHRTRTVAGLHQAEAPVVQAAFAADYGELRLGDHPQLLDSENPTHRLWSDGRWNKVTVAKGCYWHRCAFCDVQLDYIAGYRPSPISALVDTMEELVEATGQAGFHLVDEAAPPRALRDLALELLARGHAYTWWGNIRFEAAFTPDLCRLLAAAGMVAATGGLEVASDRLLTLMDKGITVEQATRAAEALRGAGVMVHAYLMYGFPTQTDQESVDAMDLVRQLFAQGLLSSAFWHRFVLTRHSQVFADPERFGVWFRPPRGVFAANDIPHHDPGGGDHDRFDEPLVQALAAWMRGEDLERPVASWLPTDLPAPSEPTDRVTQALRQGLDLMGARTRLLWIGGEPLQDDDGVVLHGAEGAWHIHGSEPELDWVMEVLDAARPVAVPLRYAEARAAFPGDWAAFADRWHTLRAAGLLGV
jgi:hypothetical protein